MSAPAKPRLSLAGTFALVVAAGALAGHGRAAADADRAQLELRLVQFDIDAEELHQYGMDPPRFRDAAAVCDQVVADLAKAGAKPTDLVGGSIPFKRAGEICRRYAGLKAVFDVWPAIEEAARSFVMTEQITPGWGDASYGTKFGEQAAACSAAIDKALAQGASADIALRLRDGREDRELTLPQLRTAVCDKLGAWAKDFGAATTKAKDEQKAAARQRYAQFGAAGDRLEWLAYYDADAKGTTWYTPGCKGIDDPKKLAKAPVLMQWWTADDGTVTIRRFQFKGNKLVKDTSKTFLTEAKATASGCK